MAERRERDDSGVDDDGTPARPQQPQRGQRQPREQRHRNSATAARRVANARTGSRDYRPWMIGGVITVILVALIGALVFQEITRERPGIGLADLGNLHVDLDGEHDPYNSSPPTSGPHYGGGIAKANIYGNQQTDLLQVHSLEDGHVIIQYDCEGESDGCLELVRQLTTVAERAIADEKQVLLAPYTPILHPTTGDSQQIALTAWTRIDVFDDFDEERIENFINAYEGIDHHVRG